MSRRKRPQSTEAESLALQVVRQGKGRPRHERVRLEAQILRVMPWRTPSYDPARCEEARHMRSAILALDPGYFPADDRLQPRVEPDEA